MSSSLLSRKQWTGSAGVLQRNEDLENIIIQFESKLTSNHKVSSHCVHSTCSMYCLNWIR